MKWFSILSLGALALLSNACEKHAASELPAEVLGEAHAEAAPAPDVKPAENATATPAPEGAAPKFFPETK